MLGVFAEFERAMIQERINAGIARVTEKGTKSGKPIGRVRIDPKVEDAIQRVAGSGKSISGFRASWLRYT
jgi:DNA invertase Pin-like site-specific DNA recombinase